MNLNKEIAKESLRRGVPVYAWPPIAGEGPIRIENVFDLEAIYPGAQFRDASGHLLGTHRPKPQVPIEFKPDANLKPFDAAVALLAHEAGAKPALVSDLKAKAKKHGISWTSCRRAKKFMGINTIEMDGEHYWALARSLAA
jgi:hypothetical protein